MRSLGFQTLCLTLLVGLVALPGCDGRSDGAQDAETGERAAESKLPADLIVATPPPTARSVSELKSAPELQGTVVVHGRVGGREEPFVDGIAMFLLADAEMKSCDELHGDACETPWDYCCEPNDSRVAKTATVQIADADGKPLRIGLKDYSELAPLTNVTVVGEVAAYDPDAGTLVINAKRIHVQARG